MSSPLRIVGLFAGIGGIELGFQRALGDDAETVLLCESWDPARQVLEHRFPGVEIHPDVRELGDLPVDVDLVTAGFPCTDLSQAGRTAGIRGTASGLVEHVFEALGAAKKRRRLPTLLIENVPNMLSLDRGFAMRYLIDEIERLGYCWAYRVVDSRFTGVPQRRRRVVLIASTELDPRAILFADDAGERPVDDFSDDGFGFYWTEGRGGLGWAQDAVPTLKGGSTIGIPSPPAIWLPHRDSGQRFIKPSVEDAEEMQGFDRGWTSAAAVGTRRNGPRWKLVGNAVTAEVARWVASRVRTPGEPMCESYEWDRVGRWPTAAWGDNGTIMWTRASEYPMHAPYRHLLDVVHVDEADVLSHRAILGFWNRLKEGNLGRHPGFREDVNAHIDAMQPTPVAV